MRRSSWMMSRGLMLFILLMMIPGEAFGALLSFVEVKRDGTMGVDGLNGASSVALSPDGDHVYVASDVDNAVAVFSRDTPTGRLSFAQVIKDTDPGIDGLLGAVSLTVSPDGNHVYVAGKNDNALAVFSRDTSSGKLSFVQVIKDGSAGVDGLNWVSSVRVSPDGGHLYATGILDSAVAVFSRDASSGKLSFVQVIKDDSVGGSVDGLANAISVTVSPGGSHVYVTGDGDDAVVVFSRDASTGKLSFVQVIKDTDPGIDGLDRAWSVCLSPDGRHVYVAGYWENKVAVFSRDKTTGKLTFVEVHEDESTGGSADGLRHPVSVAVSPDGNHVYAASDGDDALAVFSRDTATGRLTFVEAQKDGTAGVDGLDGAACVTVSPESKHVYGAGSDDHAVAVFTLPVFTLSAGLAGKGSGVVSSAPSGITCPGTCRNTFVRESDVTLRATPDDGSALDGWSATECRGNGDCTLTMDRDRDITASFSPDADNDGISDEIEDAGPNGGDGNQNGLPDSSEANVATFESLECGYVTLVSSTGTAIRRATFQDNPSPDDQPSGYTIPDCFSGFTVQGLNPGASTTVTLIFHEKDGDVEGYLRYGPTPDDPSDHWYAFPYDGVSGAMITQESIRTLVFLHLKDGARGDDDLTENGTITDVGAPVSRTGGAVYGGGEDTGCFITSLLPE